MDNDPPFLALLESPTDPWDIVPGEVRVGSGAQCVIDRDDVKVFEIDFNTKYAEFGGASYGQDFSSVWFTVGERTLSPDNDKRGVPTSFRLQGSWSLIAECSRYTGYVCAYRRPNDQ